MRDCGNRGVSIDRLGDYPLYRKHKSGSVEGAGAENGAKFEGNAAGSLFGGASAEQMRQCQQEKMECVLLCASGKGALESEALQTMISALAHKLMGSDAPNASDAMLAGSSTSPAPDMDALHLLPEPRREVVDALISAKRILTMDPDANSALESHAVAVDKDIIAAVPVFAAETKRAPRHCIDRSHHAALPGFGNSHAHAGLTLLRGCADDQPLLAWLHQTIWPVENAFIKKKGFCCDGALLSAAEMIRGGATTFADMHWFSGEGCKAVVESGIRALIGMIFIGFSSVHASSEEECFARGHDAME